MLPPSSLPQWPHAASCCGTCTHNIQMKYYTGGISLQKWFLAAAANHHGRQITDTHISTSCLMCKCFNMYIHTYIRTYIRTYVHSYSTDGGMTQIYPAEQQNEPQAATYIFHLHCRSSVYHKEKWGNSVKTYFVIAQFQQMDGVTL